MKSHRPARLALVALISCVAASCAGTERLVRISPFADNASSQRVNLWPLLYNDRDATSVLWPIFDVDDRGFALRPVVAADGSKWSVLFPLARFDTQSGYGWAFPFYRFERHAGIFPVANFSGGLSYAVPFWWHRSEGGDVTSGGLFPVAGFGGFNYIGPAWWVSGEETWADGGLFPVAMFGDFNHVGPAWWASGGSYGLFPLFGLGSLRHVGPVWWKHESAGGFHAGLFPLLDFDSDGSRFRLLPLYSHDLGAEKRTRKFLLGLGRTEHTAERDRSWLLPFYYHDATEGESDTALFPFFWKRTRGDTSHTYTLLGTSASDPERSSFNVLPVWWSSRSEDGQSKMLLPFFRYTEDGDDRNLLTPLGGRGWSASGESRYVNFLGPLYHRSHSRDGDEERTAVLWPLFERHRKGDARTTRALPLFSTTSSPEGSASWYALGLGHTARTASGSSHRLWPLYSHTTEEERPGFFYGLTLYGDRSHAGTTHRRLFPLYSATTSEGESTRSLLLGLGQTYRREGERGWRLWPLAAATEGTASPTLGYRTTLFARSAWATGESLRIAGPLIYGTRTEGSETRTNYALGLGQHYRRGERENGWRFWPLVSRTEGTAQPTLGYRTTLLGASSWESGSSFHLAGPLLFSRRRSTEGGFASSKTRVLTFFTDEQEEFEGAHVPRGSGLMRQNLVRRDSQSLFFGALLNRKETYRVWRDDALGWDDAEVLHTFSEGYDGASGVERDELAARRILERRDIDPGPDSTSLAAAVRTFADRNTETVVHRRARIPLLYGYERSGDEVAWNGPLWLVRSKAEPGHSRFNFLYYAYRSETTGKRTTRDIFPFITWDSGPKEKHVSFLWRVLHYQREGNKRGGHFLFIPFGDL